MVERHKHPQQPTGTPPLEITDLEPFLTGSASIPDTVGKVRFGGVEYTVVRGDQGEVASEGSVILDGSCSKAELVATSGNAIILNQNFSTKVMVVRGNITAAGKLNTRKVKTSEIEARGDIICEEGALVTGNLSSGGRILSDSYIVSEGKISAVDGIHSRDAGIRSRFGISCTNGSVTAMEDINADLGGIVAEMNVRSMNGGINARDDVIAKRGGVSAEGDVHITNGDAYSQEGAVSSHGHIIIRGRKVAGPRETYRKWPPP